MPSKRIEKVTIPSQSLDPYTFTVEHFDAGPLAYSGPLDCVLTPAEARALADALRPPLPAGACEECLRFGWAVFHVDRAPGWEIQRCDNCKSVVDDDDAANHAARVVLAWRGGGLLLNEGQREVLREALIVIADSLRSEESSVEFHDDDRAIY